MNRKKGSINNTDYVLISIGLSFFIVLTCLPFRCIQQNFEIHNIIIKQSTINNFSMYFLPIMSFVGALTTLQIKRKNMLEVFTNIAIPILLIFMFYLFSLYPKVIYVLFLILICLLGDMIIEIVYNDFYPFRKRLQFGYYQLRRRILYILIVIIGPLMMYTYYTGSDNKYERFYEEYVETIDREAENDLDVPDDDVWIHLDLIKRMDWLKELAEYECYKLGINGITISAVTGMEEGLLGLYQQEVDTIFLDKEYIESGSIRGCAHILIHEVCHAYTDRIINVLEVLDKSEIQYKRMPYFEQAVKWVIADRNYEEDLTSYETYASNYLEVTAEHYAQEEIRRLFYVT